MIRKLGITKWFGNDEDGLSMIDILTISMFIFFLIFKFLHLYLSISYKDTVSLLGQFNIIISSVDEFMKIIIIFYFSERTLDTTITKAREYRDSGYRIKEMEESDEPVNDDSVEDYTISDTWISDDNTSDIDYTTNKDIYYEDIDTSPVTNLSNMDNLSDMQTLTKGKNNEFIVKLK